LADRIGPIDLDLYPGEILGVFGLVGSGRTELLEGLFGASPFAAGTMELAGSPANVRSPAEGLARGVALVPSDRRRKALLSSLSARENVVLPTIAGLSSHGIRRRARERKVFEDAAAQLNLTPRNGRLEARRFSGGNQQKLVLARWLNDVRSCRLLLLDEPTQGVDIAARDDLYQALERFADRGRGVILTSSEPSEIVAAATRVLVLSHGRIAANIPVGDVTEDRLLALAHLGEAA
jgi:ribose transport system ATP-binding protein